jgi:hypothetical protein
VILLKVELTVDDDELVTFYEINYKNDEILVFTLFWVFLVKITTVVQAY